MKTQTILALTIIAALLAQGSALSLRSVNTSQNRRFLNTDDLNLAELRSDCVEKGTLPEFSSAVWYLNPVQEHTCTEECPASHPIQMDNVCLACQPDEGEDADEFADCYYWFDAPDGHADGGWETLDELVADDREDGETYNQLYLCLLDQANFADETVDNEGTPCDGWYRQEDETPSTVHTVEDCIMLSTIPDETMVGVETVLFYLDSEVETGATCTTTCSGFQWASRDHNCHTCDTNTIGCTNTFATTNEDFALFGGDADGWAAYQALMIEYAQDCITEIALGADETSQCAIAARVIEEAAQQAAEEQALIGEILNVVVDGDDDDEDDDDNDADDEFLDALDDLANANLVAACDALAITDEDRDSKSEVELVAAQLAYDACVKEALGTDSDAGSVSTLGLTCLAVTATLLW